MSISGAEEAIWRGYASQIKSFLVGNGDLGKDGAVFVTPLTTQGIAAGDWIDPSVTNCQLYRVSDSLMSRDSPVYIPGSGSYFSTVQQYLAYVKLNGKPTQANIIRLTAAQNSFNSANEAYKKAKKAAVVDYKDDPDNSLPFDSWCVRNSPGVLTKWDAMQAASGALIKIQQEVYGNDATVLNQQINKLVVAQSPTAQPGLNMSVIAQDISNVQANLQASQDGEKPVFPQEGIYYNPLYILQNYKALVNDWVINANNMKETSFSFSIEDGKSSQWSDYGFEHVSTKANFRYWCFLSASASYESTTIDEKLSLDSDSSSISVKVSFKGLKAISLGTGTWDVPGLRDKYPTLMDGAPKNIIPDLVKAEKILVGYAPGLEVKFDSNSYHRAAGMLDKQMKAGGRVSFFGFDIGASASGDVERTNTTKYDNVTYNAQNLTITIPAVEDSYPVLVGVLARKL